jgi:outer membrane protein TolC
MRAIKAYAGLTTAALVVALFVGCAHVKPQAKPATRSAANLNARTLDGPGLKKFVEQHLNHPVDTWPPESWDFPMLTLAALYFHPNLDASLAEKPKAEAERLPTSTALQQRALAWQVRHNLHTNLLAYVAAQRRQDLLRDLESTQMDLAQVVEKRLAADAIPPVQLSLLRIQLAETRLELIEALQKKMDFRERVADAIGLPVKALLKVEVTYDFSTPAGYVPGTGELRRQALRKRSDILLALADYTTAEAMLRVEINKRYPHARFNPGCAWDSHNDRWAVNLKLDLPSASNRGRIATAEMRRAKAAAHLLGLQSDIIDELDRCAVAYRARLEDAADIDRLTAAIRRQHDSVIALFRNGAAVRLELIMTRLQLAPAEVAQLDARESLHEALGALEDAVQSPANLIELSPMVEPERPFTSRDSL